MVAHAPARAPIAGTRPSGVPDWGRRVSGLPLLPALALAAVLLALPFAPAARADIYRWVDGGGVLHFTDDLSSIPSEYRGRHSVVIKEPRRGGSPLPPSQAAPSRGLRAGEGWSVPPNGGETPDNGGDDFRSRIEQLKAKIAAKEKLIRYVDEKRSLAVNPLRNRVVDPGDLELYDKYKAELPADRAALQELESRLPDSK
jgi:hypothetical protein